jgi:hypothetical protein
MQTGDFSNNGVDTFDPLKQYIGIRLQQGVPLLDRDWNELEDIRRYFERSLGADYIGDGSPATGGFQVTPPAFSAPNDVVISAGRLMAAGLNLWNPADLLFSEQGTRQTLPVLAEAAVLTLYVQPDVLRIDQTADPALANSQDVNIETCLRDKLTWQAAVIPTGNPLPAGAVALAQLSLPANGGQVTASMITDLRRPLLNLGATIDRVTALELQISRVEQGLNQAQLDIEAIKQDLGRLFWDVRLAQGSPQLLFGDSTSITVTVNDRLGNPIQGASVAFSTDWAPISPALVVTDASGNATAQLAAVWTDVFPTQADLGVLQQAVTRVQAASLPNGAIQHAGLRFAPRELALVSRYSPTSALVDLPNDLPPNPIVAPPPSRTVTVVAHAREPGGTIVRGVGSTQVTLGLWVRDWSLSRIFDIASGVPVAARVGDLMRQGIASGVFSVDNMSGHLPFTLQNIHDDTESVLKTSIYADPGVSDDEVQQSGRLARVVAEEATAHVGAATNQAISNQLDQYAATPGVISADAAGQARTQILQASSQILAGFTQQARQRYGTARVSS